MRGWPPLPALLKRGMQKNRDSKRPANPPADINAKGNIEEQEVPFSRGGRMKILKKEVRGDTLYLTAEESQ